MTGSVSSQATSRAWLHCDGIRISDEECARDPAGERGREARLRDAEGEMRVAACNA